MTKIKLITIITILMVLLSGCAENESPSGNPDLSKRSENTTINTYLNVNPDTNASDADPYFAGYSMLYQSKLDDIRNNVDPLSMIYIYYESFVDIDQDQNYDELNLFGLSAGNIDSSVFLNSFQLYEGHLERNIIGLTPPEGEFIVSTLLPAQVDLIFDYITAPANQGYFFNENEYTGLTQPYSSETVNLEQGDYIFVLAIYEPNSLFNAWAISKATDTPDAIWQGLIDIFEINFI